MGARVELIVCDFHIVSGDYTIVNYMRRGISSNKGMCTRLDAINQLEFFFLHIINPFSTSLQIRTFGFAMISVVISAAAFVTMKLFPILLEIVDLHGCMIILGFGCIIGFLFVLIVTKETAGQSLDDVGVNEKFKMNQIHAARINSI